MRGDKMKLITRNHYLNKLIDVKNTPDIKVITGVRRSGKSKLMDAFIDILEKEENANVIRIKLNLKEFEKLKDKEELYKDVQDHYKKEYTNYVYSLIIKTWIFISSAIRIFFFFTVS